MSPAHLLLGCLAAAIWGTNFVVIHAGLQRLPPLVFGALRFTFAAFPLVFFLPRPSVRWTNLAGYGLLVGAGQFGLLYIAMRGDISPGLASLVMQTQVFITVGLAVLLRGESVSRAQRLAMALAATGLVVIASASSADARPRGLILVLLAACSWAASNLIIQRSGARHMVAYVAWSSLIAAPTLFLLAGVFEGWGGTLNAIAGAGWPAWLAVAWQAGGNTLFGFSVWSWLLTRYPASTVAPIALLVPVFGIGSSALLLGEPLPAWKLGATTLIVLGLALNLMKMGDTRSAD